MNLAQTGVELSTYSVAVRCFDHYATGLRILKLPLVFWKFSSNLIFFLYGNLYLRVARLYVFFTAVAQRGGEWGGRGIDIPVSLSKQGVLVQLLQIYAILWEEYFYRTLNVLILFLYRIGMKKHYLKLQIYKFIII